MNTGTGIKWLNVLNEPSHYRDVPLQKHGPYADFQLLKIVLCKAKG